MQTTEMFQPQPMARCATNKMSRNLSGADGEAVKKMATMSRAGHSPPCITARRGGRAIKKISRSIRRSRGRGGFPIRTKGKPPRLRQLWWLREIFLMTQTLDCNLFTAPEARDYLPD